MRDKKYTIGFLEFLKVLRKNFRTIVIFAMLAALVSFFVSKWLITATYRADAKMIVISNNEEDILLTNDQITSAENLVDTYAVIIKSRSVLNTVIERLDLEYSYKQLNKKVEVSAINSTQVMEIAVEDESPELAKNIVDEILNVAPKMLLKAVSVGNVQTIDAAQCDEKPVSPNTLLNTMLSGFLGACFAIMMVLLKHFSNNTFVSEEEVRGELELPVLGVIPTIESSWR